MCGTIKTNGNATLLRRCPLACELFFLCYARGGRRLFVVKWQPRQTMIITDKFEVFHYSDKNISRVGLHHHDFFEVYYLVDGKVNYIIDGREYLMNSGDILLISSNELHQMQKLDNNNYERYVIWISKNWLQTLSSKHTDLFKIFAVHSENKSNKYTPTTSENKVVFDLVGKIYKFYQSENFGDDVRTNIHLIELLLFLNEIYSKSENIQTVSNELVNKAVTYIDENFTSNINIESIAKHIFISTSRLSHLFKMKTGTSVYNYIVKKRLLEAKSLLLLNFSAAKTAEKCGFCSYVSFLKLFKKEYGMTPTEYYKQQMPQNKPKQRKPPKKSA
jgi:AraC-like DNA-binding protein